MLSFWPSLSLLAFALVIFLECRAVGGRVTIPFRGFLSFFAYGCVGASLISLLMQQIPWLQFSPVENARADLIMPAAWLTGPLIEELAKILPILVLAFFTSVWRRLSIADLTVAGFASGAGFGFVENNLEALVTGKLPSFQHWWLFGYQGAQSGVAGDASVYFAGHAVYPALFALAAGIGLRLFPIRRAFVWIPAALVFVLVCFDHSLYNWKILHPASPTGGFLEAAAPVEFLYLLTLHGRLEVFLLPVLLIAAQIIEGRLCTKAMGRRGDLLLPFELGRLAVNEWAVAIMRAQYGRAAFAHTLSYFRRRRALALATLEVNRNPANRTLGQYQRLLEQRLMRERAILADPPTGTWFPPRAVFERNVKDWVWRTRWVLGFAFIFILLFMVGAEHLPVWLRNIVLDNAFAAVVVGFGFTYAAWRMYEFILAPRLDPVASEGVAYADRYTRILLLGASVASGISPALSLLVGWKVIAPGAAYLSGYFAGWIGQGGNLFSVMGLGAMGGALEAEPGPIGGALRDEIEAGATRIQRLERQIQKKITLALPGRGREPGTLKLDELLELTAKLDAERDMQGRRVRALDACEREAVESRVEDFGAAIEAVKAEFEHLKAEFDGAADAERRRLAGFEQGYNRYLAQIVREADSYAGANRALRESLRDLWLPRKDMGWALRIAQSTDEAATPVIRAFLPDLERFAAEATGEHAEILKAGIERIRGSVSAFAIPDTQTAPVEEEKPDVIAAPEPQAVEPEAEARAELEEELEAEVEAREVAVAPEPEPELEPELPPVEAEAAPAETQSPHIEVPPEPKELEVVVELDVPDVPQARVVAEASSAPVIEPQPETGAPAPIVIAAVDASDIDWVTVESEVAPPPPAPEEIAVEPAPVEVQVEPAPAVAVLALPKPETQLLLPVPPRLLLLAAPVEASQSVSPAAEPEVAAAFADVELLFVEDRPAAGSTEAISLPGPAVEIEIPALPAAGPEKSRNLLFDLLQAIKNDLYVPGEVRTFVEPRAPEPEIPAEAPADAPVEPEVQALEPVVVAEPPTVEVVSVEPEPEPELTPAPVEPEPVSANAVPFVNAPGWSLDASEEAEHREIPSSHEAIHAHTDELEHSDLENSGDAVAQAHAAESADHWHVELREIHELTVSEFEPVAAPQIEQPAEAAPSEPEAAIEEAPEPGVLEATDEIVAPDSAHETAEFAHYDAVPESQPVIEEAAVSETALEEPVSEIDDPSIAVESDIVETPAEAVAAPEASFAAEPTPAEPESALVAPVETVVEEPAKAEAVEDVQPEVPLSPAVLEPSEPVTVVAVVEEAPVAEEPKDAISAAPSPDEIVQIVEIADAVEVVEAAELQISDEKLAVVEPQIEIPAVAPAEAPIVEASAAPLAAVEAARNEFDLDTILAKLLRLEAAMREAEERVAPEKPQEEAKTELPQEAAVVEASAPAEVSAPEPVAPPVLPEQTPPVPIAAAPVIAETKPVAPVVETGPALPVQSNIEHAPPLAKDEEVSEPFDIGAPIFDVSAPAIAAAPSPMQSVDVEEELAPEPQSMGMSRGIGRGKFAKPADKKSPAAQAPNTASFRSTKYYGNANAAKTGALVTSKDGSIVVPQANSSSIRSAKFFNSSSDGRRADESDRTPQAARAGAAAHAGAAARSVLADALAEYFAKKGEAPPPMHTLDSDTLEEVIDSGRLETTRKGAAPWTFSGIPRRGDFAVRLKRGSDRFVEFIPSTVSFGQTPRYYARRVGVGTAQTYIPVEHLEYFDVDAHDWFPLKR